MKRWIVFAVFSILLGYPALANALDNTFDPGRSNSLDVLQILTSGGTGTKDLKEKKSETEPSEEEKKRKEILDKKVDDAIKKAWEEK